MALIIEVVERGGAVKMRVRLGDLPVTIGRGYDNDLILDDIYVDARHARIHVAENGAVEMEDLGSINGLVAVDGTERVPRIVATPGTQVRVGRTVLRFRDPSEPVPPAVPDMPRPRKGIGSVFANGWVRTALCVLTTGFVALVTWQSTYEQDSGIAVLGVTFGFLMLLGMWCGPWALASRVTLHRFNFGGHAAVLSGTTIATLVFFWVSAWLSFLFPDSTPGAIVGILIWTALSTASIALHLGFTSTMSAPRRWRIGTIVTAIFVVMIGALAWAGGSTFSDVPEFSGVLKPIDGDFVPTIDVADFSDIVTELKAEVDELKAEADEPATEAESPPDESG